MRAALVVVFVFAVGLFGMASLVMDNEIPMSRVGQLMQALAETRDAAPEDVAALLGTLMGEILLELEEQGIPEDVLVSLEERFAEVAGAFLAGGVTQDEFANEIAALAQELENLGEEDGGKGLPVGLLERIGLEPSAILELQGEKELTGLEIAAIAQRIIGSFAPEALPAGPPAGVPAWGNDDDDDNENDTGAGPPPGVPSGPPGGVPGGDNEDEEGNGRPSRGRP